MNYDRHRDRESKRKGVPLHIHRSKSGPRRNDPKEQDTGCEAAVFHHLRALGTLSYEKIEISYFPLSQSSNKDYVRN